MYYFKLLLCITDCFFRHDGSYVKYLVNFLRNCWAIIQNECDILHSAVSEGSSFSTFLPTVEIVGIFNGLYWVYKDIYCKF